MNLTSRLLALSLAGTVALGIGGAAAQGDTAESPRPARILSGTCESPGAVVAELRDLVPRFDDVDDQADDDDVDDQGGDDDVDAQDDDGTDDQDDDGTDDQDDDGRRDTDTVRGSSLVFQTGDDDADDQADDDGTDDQVGVSGFAGAEDALVVAGSEDSAVGVNLETLVTTPHVIAVFAGDGSSTMVACGAIGGFVSGADDDDLAVGLSERNDSGFAGIALLDDDDDDDQALDVDVYVAPVVPRG